MEFSESTILPWQSAQWQLVKKLKEADRLPHALLLTGGAGVGKKTFAKQLGSALLCERDEFPLACGQCRQCGFNALNTHPDFYWVELEEKSKQIKIDQIRELVTSLGHTAQQSGYKVAVVSPAETMNISAANALLKCLEEPTPNTLIILIADVAGQLLPTIRSRCQRVHFPDASIDQLKSWLEPQLSSDIAIEELLVEARNQPFTALELAGNSRLENRKAMSDDFQNLLEQKLSPVTLAEKWLNQDKLELLTWVAAKLMTIIRYRMTGAKSGLDTSWLNLALRADVQSAYQLLDGLNQTLIDIKKGANPNFQLVLETLFINSREIFAADGV